MMYLYISVKHVAMSVIDDEETLILEEESRSNMSEKAKDLEIIHKNISHKPIDYEKLNRLSEDFGKHFTPQQELSAEQAFWLRMSDPTNKPSDALPVKIKAPKELPKISLVNESLKKLKSHLAKFDNVVKIRTTPDARTDSEWGEAHIDYLKYTQEQADILQEIVEQAKAEHPFDKELDFAFHDVNVKHSLLHANSDPICATCKKSLFDGVHDICFLDFMKNVNSRVKSAMEHKNENI
ncbi:hypothetical protein Tco_0023960 [Tanacetum coccineum]